MNAYPGRERPVVECSEDQRPIFDIQLSDSLFDIDALTRWKSRVRERLEEDSRARSQ